MATASPCVTGGDERQHNRCGKRDSERDLGRNDAMIATVVDDDSAAADLRKESRALTKFMIDRRLARRRPVPNLERGLVRDLEDVGVVISDVWDLVKTTDRYPAPTRF
jgi:hypothetical protein